MVTMGMAFLGLTGVIGSRLGSEFLPALEEGNLWIRATMPATISLEAGIPIVNRLREILLTHPEVITVVSQHGMFRTMAATRRASSMPNFSCRLSRMMSGPEAWIKRN